MKGVCERCFNNAFNLYPYPQFDEETGKWVDRMVCWDCDFELANQTGSWDDDASEIIQRRAAGRAERKPTPRGS